MLFRIKEILCDLIGLIIYILIVMAIAFILKVNADIGLSFAYRINGIYDFNLFIKSFIVYLIVTYLLCVNEFLIMYFIYIKTKKVKIIQLIYNKFFDFMDGL